MSAKGIDAKATLTNRLALTNQKTSWLANKGMNARGFNIRTNAQLIRSCIRPSLDYGLVIIPYSRTQLGKLTKALTLACRLATSTRQNTGHFSLLRLFGLCPMDTLQALLQALWIQRTDSNTDSSCVYTHVRMAMDSAQIRDSIWTSLSTSNHI